MKLRTTLVLAAAAIPLAAAQAQTLKIGLSAEPTSADPHYHKMTQNDAFSAHVYSSLVGRSADMKLVPALATSWKTLDDQTWEFKLRDDVKFSNGKPFTSEDVLFTVCRTLNNETNVSQSYMDMTKRITDVQTPDAHTVIIKTGEPFPLMPAELARSLPIVWNGIVEHGKLTFDPKNGCGVTGAWPTVADFNNGKDAIGTGPYTLKSYVKGTGIELVRNENYWGPKPYWKEVKFVPVPSAGPRLTGLLSGDFDMIENPAARDLPRLKDNPKFGFVATPSTRLVFFQPDVGRKRARSSRAPTARTRCKTSACARRSPWRSTARPSPRASWTAWPPRPTSTCPTACSARCPRLRKSSTTPKAPRSCWPKPATRTASELTLSSTNDRYVNDGQVAQAVAQYLARVGIKTNVDAMTASIYFPKRAKREFSFSMGGWPAETGEASALFQLWVASLDSPKSLGTSNYGGFSNAEFDKVYKQAIVTVDAPKREKLLQESTQIALDNVPLIPLHFESSIWAFRKGITYEGRRDQYTLATSVTPDAK